MKLIIDIPDEDYEYIKNSNDMNFNAIKNGIPLEQLDADIKLLYCEDNNKVCKVYNKALDDVGIVIGHYMERSKDETNN